MIHKEASAKGCKAKSVNGKDTSDKVWREPGSIFQESSSSGVTQDMRNSPRNELLPMCEMFFTADAHLSPVVQSLYGCQFIGTFCFSTYQNFPRGKTGVHHKPHCLNKTVQTQCTTPSVWEWWEPSSKPLPGANRELCLHADLSREQSLARCVNSFLHKQYVQNLKDFSRGFIENRL